MNTLKTYVREGLFDNDSIDKQIDDQYYNNLLIKLKPIALKSFILKSSSHIDELFKINEDRITIFLDKVSYILINDNLINMINNYFSYFKNVNLEQIKYYTFILIQKKIDNNIAKLVQTYLFVKDKNKEQLVDKYYNALNKFVHELVESSPFFDKNTEMVMKTDYEQFIITVENNKIYLKYIETRTSNFNEVIEFPY